MSAVRRVAGLALLGAMTACAQPPRADLIAVGRVWTGDAAVPWAQAVVVGNGAITAVGDSADLLRLAGPGTEVLRGAMVVPGFMDDHTHFFQGGFQLGWVDLRETPTPEEFVRRIAAHARTLPAGEWILGGDWDHEYWIAAGTPLPDRRWIDSVTPEHPVMVTRYDSHMVLANSLALRLAGVDRRTAEVPGGEIVRRAGGEPTGVMRDAAMGLVERAVPRPTAEQLDSALARGMAHAASRGVTAVSHVSATWDEVAAFRRARAREAMTLRASIYVQLADWRNAAETLRVAGPGDAWLRVAGVKGMVDGSLGSTTAWFFRPYDDAPGTTGLTVTPVDSIRAWVAAADSAGLQVVVHAIGDRANAVLLDLFDSVATAHGVRDRRFRVEHAQHLRPEEIARFGRLGVLPSMQPYHAIDDGRWAWKRIGPERIRTTYAFRSLLDRGAGLMFGSDWTVAPIDPLLGVYAAVTRRTLDGKHPEGWVPEEKITVEEALRAYTAANAFGMFLDGVAGRLRPGLQGDLVVLDRDLTAIPAETLGDARVLATVAGGRVVYRR